MGKKKGKQRADSGRKKKQSGSSPENVSTSPTKKRGKGKKRGENLYYKKSEWGTEEDNVFRKSLQANGRYAIVEMAADGNCLFRSLSDQLFQDHGISHGDVRSAVCDYIEQYKEDFSVFLVLDENEEDEDAADFESYVSAMREDGEWGGNLELVAAAKLYRRNITVFSANLSALTIGHGAKKSSGADLHLSYHDNDHYSSVRDSTSKTKPLAAKDEFDNTSQDNKAEKMQSSPKRKNGKHVEPPPEETETTLVEENGDNKAKPQSPKLPKKNALCHCGSGKKYKRCCWANERRETRAARRMKESDDSTTKESDKASDETFEMNGNFRVLQI